MSLVEIQREVPRLTSSELAEVGAQCFQNLSDPEKIAFLQRCTELMGEALGERRKEIQRLLRRLENPEVPPDFWAGLEEIEDGNVVDMDVALSEAPPRRK